MPRLASVAVHCKRIAYNPGASAVPSFPYCHGSLGALFATILKELILDYLRQQPDVPVDKLADPAAKMGELGLDSLGLVEMLFEIEDKYGFQIEEPMRYGTMTLDEVVADLEQALRNLCHGLEVF